MIKKIAAICLSISVPLFIFLLFVLMSLPVIDSMKECESRGWDGSNVTIHYGLFNTEELVVMCNKADGETDLMIAFYDSIPGINIYETDNE